MQFSAKPLFENINVKFRNGNKYGLIGANGSGKSTFMKILDGSQAPSSGKVIIDENERVGKLNQNQFGFEKFKVIDTVIMGFNELWKIKSERERIYSLPEMTEEDGLKVADLEVQFGEMDGYTAESRAGELLISAGIDVNLHNELMSKVAPGLKLRVLLAQALFSDPDILLLDEPTNNLDINTIRWLESILNEKKSTMIIISHDRHFLNSVCTHMADIDYGEIRLYPGNYDDFMIASTQALERIKSDNAKKSAQISDLQQFVSRFSANASKARQATSRARLIEKIKLEDIKPSSRVNPFIRFNQDKKLFKNTLTLESLEHGYENEVLFSDVDLILESKTKLAIIGENGSGKSTFLRCIVEEIKANKGSVRWSENSKIGYCPQDTENEFKKNLNLYDWMSQWRKPEHDDQMIRATLGRLLFSTQDFEKNTTVCSGGEKNRLLFGKLMLLEPNILVLDEPTNHLDMESIESLNSALEYYEGTLIFVSHDREFVSSLATRIIEIKDKKFIDFHGKYDEYLEKTVNI